MFSQVLQRANISLWRLGLVSSLTRSPSKFNIFMRFLLLHQSSHCKSFLHCCRGSDVQPRLPGLRSCCWLRHASGLLHCSGSVLLNGTNEISKTIHNIHGQQLPLSSCSHGWHFNGCVWVLCQSRFCKWCNRYYSTFSNSVQVHVPRPQWEGLCIPRGPGGTQQSTDTIFRFLCKTASHSQNVIRKTLYETCICSNINIIQDIQNVLLTEQNRRRRGPRLTTPLVGRETLRLSKATAG